MRLEIHNARSKFPSPPQGKVVNANLWDLSDWLCRQSYDPSQNGLPTDLDSEAISNTHVQSAARCQSNDLSDLAEPLGHPRKRLNERYQALCENVAGAGAFFAKVFADLNE